MEADGKDSFRLRADLENPDHADQQRRRRLGIQCPMSTCSFSSVRRRPAPSPPSTGTRWRTRWACGFHRTTNGSPPRTGREPSHDERREFTRTASEVVARDGEPSWPMGRTGSFLPGGAEDLPRAPRDEPVPRGPTPPRGPGGRARRARHSSKPATRKSRPSPQVCEPSASASRRWWPAVPRASPRTPNSCAGSLTCSEDHLRVTAPPPRPGLRADPPPADKPLSGRARYRISGARPDQTNDTCVAPRSGPRCPSHETIVSLRIRPFP